MTRTPRRVAPAVALLALASFTACSGDGGDGGGSAAREAGENEVLLVDLEFQPSELTVDAGTEVTWTWTENLAHNVVADDFQSPIISEGTYEHTFAEPGEYPYQCTLHPGMEGTVTVE